MSECRFAFALVICSLFLADGVRADEAAKTGATMQTGSYFTQISPAEMLRILRAEPGTVSLLQTKDDTTIEGEVGGTSYSVYFYECDDGGFAAPASSQSACLGFEYRAQYPDLEIDTVTVNEWNSNHHYGALWREDSGDLALHLNTIVEGGITEANIRTSFAWWREVIKSFDVFMEGR